MSLAVKTDPRLWAAVKQKWLAGGKGGLPGKWNARKAMLATLEYQRKGGEYEGKRAENNSLTKWAKEKWGYVGRPGGRYLPEAVRAQLTPAEKRREDALKRGKAGAWVPYSPSVREKMRQAGIFEAPASHRTSGRAAAPAAKKKRTPAAAAPAKKKRTPAAAPAKKKRTPATAASAKKKRTRSAAAK